MYEADYKRKLLTLLTQRGCKVFAMQQGLGSMGTPDLMVCVPPYGRFMAIEMKLSNGVIRKKQIHVLRQLSQLGAATFVVYDGDFTDVINFVISERTYANQAVPTIPQ